MMNLVQLQERLRDVPMQALMQYANGANPQIPPFLALGELNRRKKMQESAAADQAQAMEGAPTVKQQIEQAAGLMALQGSRQRQAAQQQQGIQANAPMPAPNTTTSEPAQLAGGGYIDDIVVPRDFQKGGMAPGLDNLRKMMLLKKMQQRRQLANNMQRPDFAGGGIVAFQAGGRSIVDPIGAAPYESEEEKRRREEEEIASGRREGYSPEVQRRIIERSRAADRARMQESGEQERLLERGREIAREATAGREAGIGSLMKPTSAQAPRPVPIPRTPEGPLVSDTYPDETQRGTRRDLARDPSKTREGVVGRPGIVDLLPPSAQQGIAGLPDAVKRYLGVDPEKAFTAPVRQTAQQYKDALTEQNKVFGVSEDPYAELKQRFGDIEARDKGIRAEQPMDQLTRFLTGIAGSRRGAGFGEAGAAGVTASSTLRAQQQELNRKQDLDMAMLRSAIAEKEDARARGDRDKFIAADEKAKDAARAIEKDKLALQQNQAQIQNQATTAQASLESARKPAGTSTLEAARLRARAEIIASAQELFAPGGQYAAAYRKKIKEVGQEKADQWKNGIVQRYVTSQMAQLPELGGAVSGMPEDISALVNQYAPR